MRTDSNFIDLILFHLICQMLAKFSGLNRRGPYLSLGKESDNFCALLTYSIKRVREIRKFHVAVVQQRLRNVQKSVMPVQSCSFAILNLLLFRCCKNPLLLRSRNFATIVTWRQPSPLYWHSCDRTECCLLFEIILAGDNTSDSRDFVWSLVWLRTRDCHSPIILIYWFFFIGFII